jgi:hypothetical protein
MSCRLAIPLSLIALFLIPSAALARSIVFKGEGKDDPKVKIEFDLHLRKGPDVAANAVVRNVEFKCSRFFPSHRNDVGFVGLTDPVDDFGDFRLNFNSAAMTAVFNGNVDGRKKAHGFVNATEGSGPTECTTHRVYWAARAVAR